MNKKLALLLWLAVLVIVAIALQEVHIFEDGSFAFGSFPYPVSGCLPWGICNL